MTVHVKPYRELTADELYGLLQLRVAVFVVEQDCVYQELDGKDRQAIHVWIEDERGVAGCLRVMPSGLQGDTVAIGRVVARDRGCGLGRVLMLAGMEAARLYFGAEEIRLEAQSYACGFYEKLGFAQISEEFMEDGIPHVLMQWKVQTK